MGSLNVNKAAEEHARLKKQSETGSIVYLALAEGPNAVRVLPPPDGMDEAWVKGKVSFKVGPNERTVNPGFDEACLLKQHLDVLYADGTEVSKKRADRMWPKNRVFLWVVTRDPHPQCGEGPLMFSTNQNVFRDILAIIADPDYGDITDPQTGVDITINYTPKEKTSNGFPEWGVLPKRHPSPLGTSEEIADWTSKNLFEWNNTGQVSEPGWIEAVLEGKEESYLETLKVARESGQAQPAAEEPAAPVEVEAPAATPAAPVAAAPQLATQLVVPEPATTYWAVDPADGATKEMTGDAVGALVGAGHVIAMMSHDQSSGWVDNTHFGIVVQAAAPSPPTPVAAPAAPPPPAAPAPPPTPAPTAAAAAAGAGMESEEAALQAQLEALRAAKATGQPSQVSADLKNALG